MNGDHTNGEYDPMPPVISFEEALAYAKEEVKNGKGPEKQFQTSTKKLNNHTINGQPF